MSGTLEHLTLCTAGYVQHEEIMHTCNILYFHMRFKCFLYIRTSFFLPRMKCKREGGEKKKGFHKVYLHLVFQ